MAPLNKAVGVLVLMSLLSVAMSLSLERVVAMIEDAKKELGTELTNILKAQRR
jgi:hypothetical protein